MRANLLQSHERWVMVCTQASLLRSQPTLQRQASKDRASREQKCWHLSNRHFAGGADARAAFERELKDKRIGLEMHGERVAHPQFEGRARPRKDASPASQQWQIVPTVSLNQEDVAQEAGHKACWIVGNNGLDPAFLSDQQRVTTYKSKMAWSAACAF